MIDEKLATEITRRANAIPIVKTLGLRLEAFDAGTCRMRAPYDRRYDGVFESFHGGILMTVADSAACFAILTRTGPDERMATTDMNIRFLAPCREDLVVEARVLKLGRTLVPVEVELREASGKPVAVAQVSYLRLTGPTPSTGPAKPESRPPAP